MLKDYFEEAWSSILPIYESGKICSERHLQAVFCHLLYANTRFSDKYSFSIEPKISGLGQELEVSELAGIIPDMIISCGNDIVAVVEFKFLPHGFVFFQKDTKNLKRFWNAKTRTSLSIYLDINPDTGDWDRQKKYSISQNVCLIYCALGKRESYIFSNHHNIFNQHITDGGGEVVNYLLFAGLIEEKLRPEFRLLNSPCIFEKN